ncbi:MAG: DNA polymerase IV [Myxococcota bacterium]
MIRWILHADMDAFYAAIEQLDDPSLKGKPVLVGSPSGRGVVTTASYEARPYGVGSAMPMAIARRKCPQAVIVPPRFERYLEASRQVMDVFDTFSPSVEALSLDEAFLDMTGSERLFGPPEEMAERLKGAVRNATGGLTVSVGLAATKYVAKVASDYRKPDGVTIVHGSETLSFLHPLPVSRLWGAGPKVQARMAELHLETIGDVAACSEEYLVNVLGNAGAHFHRLANGQDPRAVVGSRAAKSVGSERTLDVDVSGRPEIWPHILASLDDIAHRLRKSEVEASGVRVKLKTADFRLLTRQGLLDKPTTSADTMAELASELLEEFDLGQRYRLVGAAAFQLSSDTGAGRQLDMFGARDPAVEAKRERLDQALDEVWDKFGSTSLRRGSSMGRKSRSPKN